MIGTEKKLVEVKSNQTLVKVGGGWENLQSYVTRVQDEQHHKIRKIMYEENKRYQLVLLDLLTKYKAEKKAMIKY